MEWEYRLGSTSNSKLEKINKKELENILLLNRGLVEKKSVDEFINPETKDLRDPFKFEKMNEIIDIILARKKKNEKIYIYGDYDVDGITAAVFLVKVFKNIGINASCYIPNRMEEGYGLDKKAIDFMKKKKSTLAITVDTGVNSIEDVQYAKSCGIDIIVTDHHKTSENQNNEYLNLNPKISKNYEFKYLSGAGVALKVAQALYMKLNIDLEKLYDYLDIVMIGTVADVVPMIDENRIIIKEGLKRLRNTKIKGLTYLLRYLKFQNKEINTTDVSYYISPLINSLGRIGISKTGAKFFLEEDDFEIYNIIEEMKRANKKRRELENFIMNDAIEMINEMKDKNPKSAFLYSKKWHPGVIGVVASRLSIKYNMPIALVSLKDNVGKASCRSIAGISVYNIFEKMKDKLIRFGGHDLAAGFIINKENISSVKKIFEDTIKNIEIIKPKKTLYIDTPYRLIDINQDIFDVMQKLSPFGIDNPHPLFLEKNVKFTYIKKFGVNLRHFNGIIEKDNETFNIVGFDLGDKIDESMAIKMSYDIVYYPEKVFYKGEEIIQIRIKDIKINDNFYQIFNNI